MEAISSQAPVSSILFQVSAENDNKKKFICTRSAHRFFPACGFLFLLLIHATAFTGDQSPALPRENSKAVLSAIHSEKIRGIMRRLNSLAWEREYTELQIREMRAEQIELLVQAAEELIGSAENLPEIAAQEQLSDEEQTTFRAMARQLHKETVMLREYTETRQYEELSRGYRRLHQTCNACHNLFRER